MNKHSFIQAVLFPKNNWSEEQINQYLKTHNLHRIKATHETDNFKRVRLREPNKWKYFFRIKHGKNNDPSFIVGIWK